MPFFQNVFLSSFEGNWVLGDRQHVPKFVVPGNIGRGDEIVAAWNQGTYNIGGADVDTNPRDILSIVFALREFKNWATIDVDIRTLALALDGSFDVTAAKPTEIVAAMNSDTGFADRFIAAVSVYGDNKSRITIRQKKPATEMRFYIKNGGAEEVLRFNARAGVAEMPTYFSRHTIANRFAYPDSQNHVIELDPAGSNIDADIIDGAVDAQGRSLGYDHTDIQEDWELLRGRSGLFWFQKGPGTSAAATHTTVFYHAGAIAGDLAKKTVSVIDSSSLIVTQWEMPYTLDGTDIAAPP